jgi:hypothetical protein
MKEFLKKVGCYIQAIIYIGALVFGVITSITSCSNKEEPEELEVEITQDNLVNQKDLAKIVQDRFFEIDQYSFGGRSLSLDEAEAYLFCWADENSGMEVSEDELREAIWAVLESTDLIRELIAEIDEIDVD